MSRTSTAPKCRLRLPVALRWFVPRAAAVPVAPVAPASGVPEATTVVDVAADVVPEAPEVPAARAAAHLRVAAAIASRRGIVPGEAMRMHGLFPSCTLPQAAA